MPAKDPPLQPAGDPALKHVSQREKLERRTQQETGRHHERPRQKGPHLRPRAAHHEAASLQPRSHFRQGVGWQQQAVAEDQHASGRVHAHRDDGHAGQQDGARQQARVKRRSERLRLVLPVPDKLPHADAREAKLRQA